MSVFQKSGERPVDADGRSYHSGGAFGEAFRSHVVGGSRARLETILAEYCKRGVRLGVSERDLPVFAAVANGNVVGRVNETLGVTLGAHGMGMGSVGCTLEEILWTSGQLTRGETIDVIRAGSCGSINPQLAPLGHTILVDSAFDEAGSYPWAHPSVEPRANPEILSAMVEAAIILGFPYVVGSEITNNDFYRGQRRRGLIHEIFPEGEGVVLVDESYMAHLRQLEEVALAYSMEAAGILKFCNAVRWNSGEPAIRAGVALAIYAQRDPDGGNSSFVQGEQKLEADRRCALIALLAHFLLQGDGRQVDELRQS